MIADSTSYYCNTAIQVFPNGSPISAQPYQNGASNGGAAQWFYYTPTSSGLIDITSCNGGADTYLNFWEGTCGALNLIGSEKGICSVFEEEPDQRAAAIFNVQVNSGNTYYIEWTDEDSSEEFQFQIEEYF